jgi:hypothetical protein
VSKRCQDGWKWTQQQQGSEQCCKNRFGEKIAGVQKTTFRQNRQNIGKKSANLKKYKNIHFFLIFETFKATIASNRQIAT